MIDTQRATRIATRDKAVIADALKIRYTPFALSHGDGARLFDVDGRSYIDFGAAWSAERGGPDCGRSAPGRRTCTTSCG